MNTKTELEMLVITEKPPSREEFQKFLRKAQQFPSKNSLGHSSGFQKIRLKKSS